MSVPDFEKVGRLAMRVEGDWWNAYYALPDTMEGALLLGSVKMDVVRDEGRKNAFMDLMRDYFSDILEEKTGHRPAFHEPRPAPEHEKAGKA